RDGRLVVIDPSAHDVRGSFGTQAITELARALLLAGLRPPILDPDSGRLFGCIAPACREDVLPLDVLQRHDVLAHELWRDWLRRRGVSRTSLAHGLRLRRETEPAKRAPRSAGFAICSPQGMGEPHDITPRGS